ncbi:hypothetical protein [Sediminimonas qiaohouensis]|uniref:hypothetical protein n=1 Tax=Sediminimonas qiaohouensis TaxID=552061 RepID=UPI002355B517|nr:hypothetical protein [Sediminimonas qiaohouensis]
MTFFRNAANVCFSGIGKCGGPGTLSGSGVEIIGQIQGILSNRDKITALPRLLAELKALAEQLDHNEKSAPFHNQLRGFVYVWGDEFEPEREKVSPLLSALFDLHGFPYSKHKPM